MIPKHEGVQKKAPAPPDKRLRAIALFSGGLDSILACRLVARQGIEVLAVKFVTPFFDYHLLAEPDYPQTIRAKYGIEVQVHDISREFLTLLRSPAHGYGKHFNPCLDCKIFMMTRARQMMAELGASFLISGEVVGQRPMSQRRDTMRVVERDSASHGLLLRPLCAKHLDPTPMEASGLVDREGLCDFAGRGRSGQIALAAAMGIDDYPSPAGGCVLTDPIVGERIKRFYQENDEIQVADMRLMTIGRHFALPGGARLIMGRRENENPALLALAEAGDLTMRLGDRPGPSGVLRHLRLGSDLELAAGLIARYGKKGADGKPYPGQVECQDGTGLRMIDGRPPAEALIRDWLR